ncbi:hypothetical protein JCM11641_006187 [Rhodosporidiobolus odoratus]
MGRHAHHRPRSDSLSSSSSDSDGDTSSSSSTSSAPSSSDSSSIEKRRRRHPSHRKKGRHKHHGSSLSSSSSDSDDDATHLTKKQRKEVLHAGMAILVFCVAVGLYYALSGDGDASTGSDSTGSAGSAAGGTGGAGTTKASNAGGSSSSKPSSAASKASAPAGSSKPAASPSKSSSGGGGGSSASPTAGSDDPNNTGPYKLLVSHQGDTFFDGWDFFTASDPTHGQVEYVSLDDAKSAGLVSTSDKAAMMKVDNTTKLDVGGTRKSIRIASSEAMKIGSIVIADIVRMPFGCATWPAWWTVGGDWPNNGEIDILEGVNVEDTNQYTLHVKDSDCKQDSGVDIAGTAVAANNDCNANNDGNAGCSYAETAKGNYGEAFNAAGGGVFVTEFTADAISIWFWSRPDIPDNIASGSPDSKAWGRPSATWPKSSCDIASYFGDQTLVFDVTLCGDWAGADGVWSAASTCSSAAATCSDYVLDPANFAEAYWEVGYVKVYSTG